MSKSLFRPRVYGEGLPLIDPASLPGLELYLRSDQVAGANGDPVVTWNDISGNARHVVRGVVAANTPTLLLPGSPNGTRAVRFDGAADPNGDYMEGSIPVGFWPDNINGYTFYFVGRFYTPINPTDGSIIWSDQTSGRPQLIMDEAGGNRMGWRDTAATQLGGAFADDGWTTMEWVFRTPFGTSAKVFRSGVEQASGTWNWNSFVSGPAFYLGMGPLVVSTKMDLGACLWYSRGHDDATLAGVRRWLRSFFG